MNMSKLNHPRLRIAHLPTPLEPLDNLSRQLGGPRIWVKRDDCTGLATGGNKTRKLEFLIADALRRKAETLVTVGATQSNHVRQTAAAARFGLGCEVLLEREVVRDDDYANNGNILLDRLFGAKIHQRPPSDDLNRAGEDLAAEIAANGDATYFIPTGGSSPVGALGYVVCALELAERFRETGIEPAAVIVATGSQGTQAGLLTGFSLAGVDVPVIGITVSRDGEEQADLVWDLTRKTAELAEAELWIGRGQVLCDGAYFAPGYGQPNDGMVEALSLTARTEGLILDPVYSGKAMAGLIAMIRSGRFGSQDPVVFLHTGGATGLFGYRSLFSIA